MELTEQAGGSREQDRGTEGHEYVTRAGTSRVPFERPDLISQVLAQESKGRPDRVSEGGFMDSDIPEHLENRW